MTRFADQAATALKAVGAVAFALMLSGCVITSTADLLPDSEAVTPLPETIFLTGYDKAGDTPGLYRKSADAPSELRLIGNTYLGDDDTRLRFSPLAGEGSYLMAVVGPDGNIYGVATYRDSILGIEIIIEDEAPLATIEAERQKGGAASVLTDVSEEDGALVVGTRAALDYVVAMTRNGSLPLEGLVMYVATSADEAAPETLAADGGFYRIP